MLYLVGLNHKTAPIEVREKLVFTPDKAKGALAHLRTLPGVREAVLLSTCNRTEAYLHTDTVESCRPGLYEFLHQHAQSENLKTHLYALEEEDAARHLFRVACGLDSMVIGEHEILGQVKTAYGLAQSENATGKLLNVLFQRSLFLGKLVRTETGLNIGASSIGAIAVTLAERIFGDLSDNSALILGAGKMAELTAKRLALQKIGSILVANRTHERAVELAKALRGTALPFPEVFEALERVDIVICATSTPEPLITAELIRQVMPKRHGRLLFFIDIAMPRNVHPDVHRLENVYVYNLDDLQGIVNENLAKRMKEVKRAEALLEDKAREFASWLTAFQKGEDAALQHHPRRPTDGIEST